MEQSPKTRRPWPVLLLEGLVLLGLAPGLLLWWLYGTVRPLTVWELNRACPSAAALMQRGQGTYLSPAEELDWTKPGVKLVLVKGEKGGPRLALVLVQDTQAPKAQALSLTLQAGEEPTADAFITGLADAQRVAVSYEQAPPFDTPGMWPLVVRLEDMSGNATLLPATVEIVEPETPPVPALDCAFIELAYTRPGEPLGPSSLLLTDEQGITCRFASAPDWNAWGYQTLSLLAANEDGAEAAGETTVLISPLPPLTLEASRQRLTAGELTKRHAQNGDAFWDTLLVAFFTPSRPGCYDINVAVDGRMCVQRLVIEDTIAPVFSLDEGAVGYVDHPLLPEELLFSADDETQLSYRYVVEPDWSKVGEASVEVEAWDLGGNTARATGTVAILQDTEPPQIFSVNQRYGYLGEAYAYYLDVTVVDNADEEQDIALTVDASAVNIYRPGTYSVTYTATDKAGNTATLTRRIQFIRPQVTDEELAAAADRVLSHLVTEDMTLGQKAYAVFRYVHDTFTHTYTSNKKDWKYEAYRGLTQQRGDCFTYCGAAKALLERLGARAMVVERYKMRGNHYWLLVDLGSGWYHWDAYNSGMPPNFECFMKTTQQTRAVTTYFWRFNESLYPKTAEKPFIRDW